MASIVNRNGRYSVVYYYKDSSGKRKQQWETQESLSSAKLRKGEIEDLLRNKQKIVPAQLTMQTFLDDFIRLYGSKKWSLSTYASNIATINKHIVPVLENRKLGSITAHTIDEYYYSLMKNKSDTVSECMLHQIHKLLRCAFNQALRWGYITENPVLFATLPAKPEKKTAFWSENEVATALQHCTDEILALCIHLAFAGTMRIGEILALTWDDISSDCKEVTINKTIKRVSIDVIRELGSKDIILMIPSMYRNARTALVLKKPKTEFSCRTVFLPDTVADHLLTWRSRQKQLMHDDCTEYKKFGLVFAQATGRPYTDTMINNRFHQLIAQTNLPSVVFHSLRHSSITFKLKLTGGNIKCVQGNSGHSQSTMVTDLYAHTCDADRKQSSQWFNEIFYRSNIQDASETVDADEIDEVVKTLKEHPELLSILQNLLINL